MKSSFLVSLFIVVVLSIGGYFTYHSLSSPENLRDSEAARSLLGADKDNRIIYTDLDGNQVDLTQYKGKIRIVNSWATWCPFCKEELLEFEKLAAELGDDGVVIAINRGEPAAKIKAYLAQAGSFENIIFLKDESDSFYKTIGGFSMPETVYYDKTGALVIHKRGSMKLDEMKRYWEEIKDSVE